MQRFHSWEYKISPDFWRDRFRPKDLLRVTAFANSLLSMRYDARLMEKYDIQNIPEHNVGTTKIWETVEFGEPTYDESNEDFPWAYEIDSRWLYVDAIYDKHVDPDYELQNGIDFELSEGQINFAEKLPEQPMYISKGRFAEYRIYQEIGHLLDYRRLDSVTYRDSIEPILAAFFLGPTTKHLLAVLNVLVGFPVAKFGNETITSIHGDFVETDRYTYIIKQKYISVKEGDVLEQFQPLTDYIEIETHKTHPFWWMHHSAELFSKYKVDGPINTKIRNYLMRTFLYNVVAYVNIKLDYEDIQAFVENDDIRALFMDALPTRTDILIGQSHPAESWDTFDGEVMNPNTDLVKPKLPIASMYGFVQNPLEMYIYSPDLGRPVIQDEGDDPLRFTMDDWRWHIFDADETDNFKEFWKQEPQQIPYVEPNYDRIYLRLTLTPPWEHKEIHATSKGIPASLKDLGFKINNSSSDTGGIYSVLPMDMSDQYTTYNLIPNEYVSTYTDMEHWDLDNVTLTAMGLELLDDGVGYAVSTGYALGGIPKTVRAKVTGDIPAKTSIKVEYSLDKETWTEVGSNIRDVAGSIYFKFTLTGTIEDTPQIESFKVTITA